MRIQKILVSLCLATLICAPSIIGAAAKAQQDASEANAALGSQQNDAGSAGNRFSPEQRQRLRQFLQRRGQTGQRFNGKQRASDQSQAAIVDPDKIKLQTDVPYGTEERQKLDVYSPKESTGRLPVLFFVHGGGWQVGNKNMHKQKGISYAESGVITVCTNYRLAPAVMHPKQIQDIASAFAWVKSHATELGADPNRIYIMGHSAGAQLVDLLGTNERFLKEKDLSLKDIRGVVSLDTASLNLGQRISDNSIEGERVGDMITSAFGSDPKVLADASPTLCIHSGIVYPPFLMFCGARRKDCVEQHARFSEAMKKAGGAVTVKPVPLSHADISKEAGRKDSAIFNDVMAMIKSSGAAAK